MKSGKSTGKTNVVGTQTDDTLNAKIFEELSKIEEIDGIKYELNKFKEGLSKLKYDKDDPEDYNNALHQLIDKYIYSSDTRVSASDWSKIEGFLKAIGYKRLDIKPGQSITPYRTYFKQPIMAKTDDKSKDMTIKQVQQQPYTKKVDGEEYKLCGKCTYWKYNAS